MELQLNIFLKMMFIWISFIPYMWPASIQGVGASVRGSQYGLPGVVGLKRRQKLEEKQTVFRVTGAVENLAATIPTCAYAKCSLVLSKMQM